MSGGEGRLGDPKKVENWGHLKDMEECEAPGDEGMETEHLGVSGKKGRMCHVEGRRIWEWSGIGRTAGAWKERGSWVPGETGFGVSRRGMAGRCSGDGGSGTSGIWERSGAELRAGSPPPPGLTEEGRQVGHRLQEGPRLDLLVRRQRLQQVLRQQRHFGVEAGGDAPAGAAGVHAAPRAAAVSAGAVTAARRRLRGLQRRHFRSRRAQRSRALSAASRPSA